MSNSSRDYSKTGTSTGGGQNKTFVAVKMKKKTGGFFQDQTKEGELPPQPYNNISGYTDDAKVEWRDKNEEHDIPGHWRYSFEISMKEGEEIVAKVVQLSWSSNTASENMLNFYLKHVQDPTWLANPWTNLSCYMKNDYAKFYANAGEAMGPQLFQWDRETNDGFQGVPKKEQTGTDENGQPVYSHRKKQIFWLAMWLRYTGQRIDTSNLPELAKTSYASALEIAMKEPYTPIVASETPELNADGGLDNDDFEDGTSPETISKFQQQVDKALNTVTDLASAKAKWASMAKYIADSNMPEADYQYAEKMFKNKLALMLPGEEYHPKKDGEISDLPF